MVYLVALIECKKWLPVKMEWVENPVLGQKSNIFFSQNENAASDFSKPIGFYLNERCDGVYEDFIYRKFGECYY